MDEEEYEDEEEESSYTATVPKYNSLPYELDLKFTQITRTHLYTHKYIVC